MPGDTDALDELKYLNIRGDVKVPQEHKEMEDAVTMVCTDVGHIGAEDNDESGVGDMIKDALTTSGSI